jgi:hypothetical protein
VLPTLAQTDSDQALAQGYWLVVAIAAIGLVAILLLLLVFLGRRWTQRQLKQIEQDKAQRRAMRSAGRVDAWQAGAERYVDRDKLTDASDDDRPGEGDDEADAYDEDDDPPPPGWDEPGPDDDADPYGLFDGKPYREADDGDELDDEDDGEEWGDDEEDDDDDEDPPRGR